MEVVTGSVDAEFGDKTSLVANVTTRTGLGRGGRLATLDATTARSAPWEAPWHRLRQRESRKLPAIDGLRSGRFLDTPSSPPSTT